MKTRKEIRRQIVEDQQRNQDYLESKPSQEQSDVTLKVEHTPTPWIHAQAKSGHQAIYDATEKVQLVRFGEGQDEDWREPKNAKANAAFIVKAVNCHEYLVNALKQVQIIVDAQDGMDRLGIAIAKVLAKAEGK